MKKPKNLKTDELNLALTELTGWVTKGSALFKTYMFADFVGAFGFMTRAALVAEKMEHHPDWRNVYRTVEVTLTTHDSGGVTALDVELARAMDRLAVTG